MGTVIEAIAFLVIPVLAGISVVGFCAVLAIIAVTLLVGTGSLVEKFVTNFVYLLDERGGVDWSYVLSRAAEWSLGIVFLWIAGITGLLTVLN